MFKKAGGNFVIKDKKNARDLALICLLWVTENGLKTGTAAGEAFKEAEKAGVSQADKALAERIITGTLGRMYTVDEVINGFASRPAKRMRPVARGILRISVYQLMYMERIPHSACCNEAVKLAKLHGLEGLTGFINALLRAVAKDLEEGGNKINGLLKTRSGIYSVPVWLDEKICAGYGEKKAEEIYKAWLLARQDTLRYNLSGVKKENPEGFITGSLAEEGFEPVKVDVAGILQSQGLAFPEGRLPVMYEYGGGDITKSTAFKKGWVCVQDASSALSASYAAPRKGDRVIDVCAAPGGKSLALSDLMEGSGSIEARDLSQAKVRLIEENVRRCGFSNIKARVSDATVLDEESLYRADILMADLPCSGLGTVSKKPDIKLRLKPYSPGELRNLQRDILTNVSRYVKPRGRLIYSTCTILEEENHMNSAWAADELGFTILSEAQLLPGRHNDGFYIAVLQKKY